MKINFQETLRFVLNNAFKNDDPELTQELGELYRECPTLFGKVLSRTDQDEKDLAEDDETLELNQPLFPAAINRIASKDVSKDPHPANGGSPLPFRAAKEGTPTFRKLIRLAYEHDYDKERHYPSAFEDRLIQYSAKFGFTDRYVLPVHSVHSRFPRHSPLEQVFSPWTENWVIPMLGRHRGPDVRHFEEKSR
jgi:hypothetical protein